MLSSNHRLSLIQHVADAQLIKELLLWQSVLQYVTDTVAMYLRQCCAVTCKPATQLHKISAKLQTVMVSTQLPLVTKLTSNYKQNDFLSWHYKS